MNKQSYTLDGTRHRTVRDPRTGVCCLYRGPADQPPEADELVKTWQTAPDFEAETPETDFPQENGFFSQEIAKSTQNKLSLTGDLINFDHGKKSNRKSTDDRDSPQSEGQKSLW